MIELDPTFRFTRFFSLSLVTSWRQVFDFLRSVFFTYFSAWFFATEFLNNICCLWIHHTGSSKFVQQMVIELIAFQKLKTKNSIKHMLRKKWSFLLWILPIVHKYSIVSYFYNVISECFIWPIQSYLQLLLVSAEVDGSKNEGSRAFFSKALDLRYILFTIDCYAHSWQIQKKHWARVLGILWITVCDMIVGREKSELEQYHVQIQPQYLYLVVVSKLHSFFRWCNIIWLIFQNN